MNFLKTVDAEQVQEYTDETVIVMTDSKKEIRLQWSGVVESKDFIENSSTYL